MSEEPMNTAAGGSEIQDKHSDRTCYKVVLDLKGFPYAQEMIVEDDDGRKIEGIFIPYEKSFIYRHEKHAFVNLFAAGIYKKKDYGFKNYNEVSRSHNLIPFVTAAQNEELKAAGLNQHYINMGWMERKIVKPWKSRFDKDNGNNEGK